MIAKIWPLIIILTAETAFAQESTLDSLARALEDHQENDTVRLNLLNELSYAFYTVNPDKGIEFSTQAIALAKRLNNLSYLATAYSNKGVNHWAKGEDSLAMNASEQALEIHRKTGNKLGAAKALNNLALEYYNLSDFKKALEYHDAALSLFEELDHNAGIAHSYANSGVVYLSLSDYPKALENFLNGARFVQDGDSILLANILLNVGLVYKNMKEYEKAHQYAKDALHLYIRSGQKQGEANALGNLGTLYSEQGAPENALRCYRTSLELNTAIGNKRRISGDLVNIAVVYQGMKDYVTALHYLQQSLKLYEQTNDKENTAFTLVKLAEVYLEAPQLMPGKGTNLTSSENILFNYLQRALNLAEESGSLQSQRMTWETMSMAFEKYGYRSRALEAYKKHIAFRDSIYNSEKDREIARQQIQFEFEKKEALLKAEHEKSMALTQAEIDRQKTIEVALLAGAIFVLIAAVTGYILYKKRKDAEKSRTEAEFRALMADTRMKALRAQMNPHFIFNSLNAISNFIGTNRLEFADDYLMRFSKIIRMILENSEHREITLADDLKILELYIQLEKMRLQDQFVYQIEVAESIDPENTVVPPLILQPLVENSIWHGMSKMKSGGKIAVRIREKSGKLICTVEDNGPGRHNDIPEEGAPVKNGKKSLGIRITQSRIDILNEQAKSGADIAFTDMPQGLRVTISLPLLHKF